MNKCENCGKMLNTNEVFKIAGYILCREHYTSLTNSIVNFKKVINERKDGDICGNVSLPTGFDAIEEPNYSGTNHETFDSVEKPEHYHKYEMDTITFLEQGFHPNVSKYFALGSAIKYLQRSELKNGLQDLEKAEFYVKKLIEYKKKENPSE